MSLPRLCPPTTPMIIKKSAGKLSANYNTGKELLIKIRVILLIDWNNKVLVRLCLLDLIADSNKGAIPYELLVSLNGL